MFLHPEDKIKIEEEGELQRCPRCCMFVGTPHAPDNNLCQQGAAQKEKREMERAQEQTINVKFYILGEEVETVATFKYLGRWLACDDSDQTAVTANLQKARDRWGRVSRVLTREGANPQVMASFYKAIVQSVLLFASETWCPTDRQWKMLETFHNRCARHITRRHNTPNEDGTWNCPDMETTLREANLQPIRHYVEKRKKKLLAYAENRAIYRKCKRTTRTPRASHKVTWWSINSLE